MKIVRSQQWLVGLFIFGNLFFLGLRASGADTEIHEFTDERFSPFMGNIKIRLLEFDPTDPNKIIERASGKPDEAAAILDRLTAAFGDPNRRAEKCKAIYADINRKMIETLDLSIRVAPGEGDVCNLRPTGELQAYYEDKFFEGGILALKYITRGNEVKWHQTLPDWVPGVLDADPQLVARFDIEIVIKLLFRNDLAQGQARPIVVTFAKVRVQNSQIQAENVSGYIAKFLVSVYAALGGKDYFRSGEDGLNATITDITESVNRSFDGENNQLITAKQLGFTRLSARIDPDDTMQRQDGTISQGTLFIVLGRYTNPIPAGDGSIAGKVRWLKEKGAIDGAPPCDGLEFIVEVQSGKKWEGELSPPMTKVGNIESLSHSDAGEFHECSYRIVGLPINTPLYLSVIGKGTWVGSKGHWDIVAGRPENFSNPFTLKRHPGIARTIEKPVKGLSGRETEKHFPGIVTTEKSVKSLSGGETEKHFPGIVTTEKHVKSLQQQEAQLGDKTLNNAIYVLDRFGLIK